MAYIISLDHYLDEKGSIALEIRPTRKIAAFATKVVAQASNIVQSQVILDLSAIMSFISR